MEEWNNITGFMDLMTLVDSKVAERSAVLTVGSALLFMVFAISLLSTKRMGTDTSFAFASFMGFMTALFLLYLGFINMGVFVFMALLLFIAVIFLLYKKREKRG